MSVMDRMPAMPLRTCIRLVILFSALLLTLSCGKKEPPRLPVPEKPVAPSSLGAVHREGRIILHWDYPGGKASSVAEFIVMKSSGGGFDKIAATKELSYEDTDFMIGAHYKYKVLARGLDGALSADSNIIEAAPRAVPPPPSGLAFEVTAEGIRLSWSAPQVGALYNVYKSTVAGDYSLYPLNARPLAETSYLDGAVPGAPVFYTVRALLGGPLRDEGPPSAEVSVRPEDFVPSRVKGLDAVRISGGVLLYWDENPEKWVVGYRIYRASEGGTFGEVGSSRTPAFTDRDVPPGRVLYTVRAMGPKEEGPPSETVKIEPEAPPAPDIH